MNSIALKYLLLRISILIGIIVNTNSLAISQTEPNWNFGPGEKRNRITVDSSRYLENLFLQVSLLDTISPSILIIHDRRQQKVEIDSLTRAFQSKKTIILENVHLGGRSTPLRNETVSNLFLKHIEGKLKREAVPCTLQRLVIDHIEGLEGASFLIKRNIELEYLFIKSQRHKRLYRKIKYLKNLKTLLVHGSFTHLPGHIRKLESLHTLRIASPNMPFDPAFTKIKSLKSLQILQPTKNLSKDLWEIASMDHIQNLMIQLEVEPNRTYNSTSYVATIPFGPEMKSLGTLHISIGSKYGQAKAGQWELVFPKQFTEIPHLTELIVHTRINSLQSLQNILANPELKKLRLSGFYVGNTYSRLSPEEIIHCVSENRPDIKFELNY